MKLRNILSTTTGSAFTLAALIGAPYAYSANGIQFDEFDVSGSVYIECLGEFIDFQEHIRIAYHEFLTPSGNYHLVDSWTFTLTATGASTGRTWAGVLPWPGGVNAGHAEVVQFNVQGVIRSITKQTPNFFWGQTYKTTVNANGDLVVERGSFDEFNIRCTGPK
jgi:hypothetical protein